MKISVIIPAYNCEGYIARCLDSVKAQTFAGFECIVVDDGSRDGTARVARETAAGDPRFRVVSAPKNVGIADARNIGLSLASGDALYCLDADDWIERNALEFLVAQSEKYPTAGRIYTIPMREFQNGWPARPWRVDMEGLYEPDDPLIFSGCFCDLGHATGALYVKKNINAELAFPRGVRVFEDLLFNMGLLFSGIKTVVAQAHHYHYLSREGSIINSASVTYARAERANKELARLASLYEPTDEMYWRFSEFLNNALMSQLARSQGSNG